MSIVLFILPGHLNRLDQMNRLRSILEALSIYPQNCLDQLFWVKLCLSGPLASTISTDDVFMLVLATATHIQSLGDVLVIRDKPCPLPFGSPGKGSKAELALITACHVDAIPLQQLGYTGLLPRAS